MPCCSGSGLCFLDFLCIKRVYYCGNSGLCGKPVNDYVGTEMGYIYLSTRFQSRELSTPPSSAHQNLEVCALILPDLGSSHCLLGDQPLARGLPLCCGGAGSVHQSGWKGKGVQGCDIFRGVTESPGHLQVGHC